MSVRGHAIDESLFLTKEIIMFCYAIFHNDKQIRVYPYNSTGGDWGRARALAIEFANKGESNGYKYTVEHFGVSGVGTIVW